MTLLKVFRRMPEVAAAYADIRGGLTDGARRTWVREMIVECSMYRKVAGLFDEK